ncbi:MAG: serine/threonine-protein kinase, partial [Verrucomicrobiota bacterium]|nr:serine/threonine-protein kinase [Verrucomicrobiota bacterium]
MKTKWELSDGVDRSLMESLLHDEGEIIKQSPAKSVTRHEADGAAFYVKRSRHSVFPLRRQKYWFKECPARWEWRVAGAMHSLDIPVVEHLAFCENWSLTGLQEDILITSAFGGQPLHLVDDVDAQSVLRFVNECHEKGMVHGDLHPANILINPTSGELRLADLKGVRLEREPNPAKQKEDLAYLNIHFPMPLSPELLRLSDRVRREKMAVRSRRCLKNNREFGPKSCGKTSWWIRKPMANEALGQVLAEPDSVLRGETLLKAGRTSTVGQQGGFVLKR